jgi:hypothetical protein
MPDRCLGAAVLFATLIGVVRISTAAAAPQAAPAAPESPALHQFTQSVQQYIKLQKAVPRLRTTKKREEIVERREALREKIREARAGAKQGDIFTPEASEEFRRVIRSTFQGPKASNVRKTIRQGEPLQGWHLTVNGDYPERLPMTTVPPTLLLGLPTLPAEVAYRIIGHDFVLEDKEARLIVDFIPGVIP